MVLGVYVVPDTSQSWGKQGVEELVQQHTATGAPVPKSLYMDCACCNGKPGFRPSTIDPTTRVAALWRRSKFAVKLDAMHLMLQIGREMNAKHPRRKKFLVDLSCAIFAQHEGDRFHLKFI